MQASAQKRVLFVVGILSLFILTGCTRLSVAETERIIQKPLSETSRGIDKEVHFKYAYFDNGRYSPYSGIYIIGYEGDMAEIIIPATIGEKKIIGIIGSKLDTYEILFGGLDSTKFVTISEGIEYISDYAFMGYRNLRNIELPDSIRYVGYQAFENTAFINDIEQYDEEGFLILNHVLVNYIGVDSTVVIPEHITVIAADAFSNCVVLEKVILPQGLISIGEYAFSNCENLKRIEIPDGVEEIGYGSFSHSGLEEVILPKDTGYVDPDVFRGTPWLENEINKSSNNDFKVFLNIVLEYIGEDEVVTVPDGIKHIGREAFYEHEDIKEINLPKSLESIQYNAFGRTGEGLVVHMPSDITLFGYGAFQFSGLQYFDFPENVRVDRYAFRGCSWAENPQMYTNGFLLAGESLFGYNGEDETIIIPRDVKYIETSALSTVNMKEVILPETLLEIDNMAYSSAGIETLTIPGSVEYVGGSAFARCKNLYEVTVDEGVNYLSEYMFLECSKLKEVRLPDTLLFIGYGAFSYCESLEKIVIPESVVYIGEGAFRNCGNLKEVVISEHTFVEPNAFEGTALEGKI